MSCASHLAACWWEWGGTKSSTQRYMKTSHGLEDELLSAKCCVLPDFAAHGFRTNWRNYYAAHFQDNLNILMLLLAVQEMFLDGMPCIWLLHRWEMPLSRLCWSYEMLAMRSQLRKAACKLVGKLSACYYTIQWSSPKYISDIPEKSHPVKCVIEKKSPHV